MKFKGVLTEGELLKRHYRFLAEVALKNRQKRMLFCPNLNALPHCDVLGSRIWYSNANRLSQGYLDTWELTEVNGGWLVDINPYHSNLLVREAVENGIISELQGYRFIQARMVTDLNNGIELLAKVNGEQCFLHIEPVFYGDEHHNGYFPDEKGNGKKQLSDLIILREMGHRAILLYCIQHNGVQVLRPNDILDPGYGTLLRDAVLKGVEVFAYRANIGLREIMLESKVPIFFSENITSN